MNILFFLTPKRDVAYIYEDYTIRQTLEKMEYHRYSSIPILTKGGKYVGTITEGDLLWTLKDLINKEGFDIKEVQNLPIKCVDRRKDNVPVSANANMELLISKAVTQNFVPVIDDTEIFIGIIKRREIIEYYSNKINS